MKILLFGMTFLLLITHTFAKDMSPSNLEGKWKVIDYRIPGQGVADYIAKENIGRIAVIKSNVLKVKLSDMQFECKIRIPLKNTIPAENCDAFNPDEKAPIKIEDFHFTPKVYLFHTEKIRKNRFSFDDLIVDDNCKKMILLKDGTYYLLQRQ